MIFFMISFELQPETEAGRRNAMGKRITELNNLLKKSLTV